MVNTNKAILRSDRLEWSDEAPELTPEDGPVAVHVTILDQPAPTMEPLAQGQRMAAALEALAETKVFIEIDDSVAWERETRTDRALPDRES